MGFFDRLFRRRAVPVVPPVAIQAPPPAARVPTAKRSEVVRPIPNGPIGFRLIHELEGMLTGMRADGRIVQLETDRVVRWLAEAAPHRHVRPFSEIIEHLDRALADGVLTMDETDDLIFVAQRYTTVNPHFGAMRTGIQVLMGILAGVSADRVIPQSELLALSAWLEDWQHLGGIYPYDECESLVVALLAKPLDLDIINHLLALTDQFPIAGAVTDQGEVPPLLIGGICAVDPIITFAGRQFVFTGESERVKRAELEALVSRKDGRSHPRVNKEIDYLVVCDCGSPYWAFACYGRKVEQAFNMRRKGHHVAIVRESDFWDALVV